VSPYFVCKAVRLFWLARNQQSGATVQADEEGNNADRGFSKRHFRVCRRKALLGKVAKFPGTRSKNLLPPPRFFSCSLVRDVMVQLPAAKHLRSVCALFQTLRDTSACSKSCAELCATADCAMIACADLRLGGEDVSLPGGGDPSFHFNQV